MLYSEKMNFDYSNIHIKTVICRQNVDFLMLQLVLHTETIGVQTVKPTTKFYHVFFLCGDRGSSVVEVLCYKSEGRWFDPSWCHWNFSLT